MILSIDVGITNMAFCIIDKNLNIIDWKALDLQQDKKRTCSKCLNLAKFCDFADTNSYCNTHTKGFIKVASKNINVYSDAELKDVEKKLCKCLKQPSPPSDATQFIKTHADAYLLVPLKSAQKAKNVSLIEIGKSLRTVFDKNLTNLVFEKIIIENQISPIATRMKTIQGMIAQYFIMKDIHANIEFVSSANKLKGLGKMTYKERKKAGIEHCKTFLQTTQQSPAMCEMFSQSKKKDDLADSLLQGLYWLQKSN